MNAMQKDNAEKTENTKKEQNEDHLLSREIIGCAVEVQRTLGTGLLESAYSAAMEIEMASQGLYFEREVSITASYKGHPIGVAYRADFIVENQIIIELKAVDAISEAHKAQLLTYLRWSNLKLGLLMNFHDFSVAKSAKRIWNNWV